LLVIWVGIDVPFVAAFEVDDKPGVWGWHKVISAIVDFFFVADVLLNFNTGVAVHGKVSLDRWVIAKEYLKSWFLVDVISAFPLDYVINGFDENGHSEGSTASGASRLVKVSKIGKVVRCLFVQGPKVMPAFTCGPLFISPTHTSGKNV
jgi:hypothetical protein